MRHRQRPSRTDTAASPNHAFLPTTREEMASRGWDALDFLVITGDAYVDHPTFGHAIVSRLLESFGYRVGILSQPDWRSRDDFACMGAPRLATLVTAGNLDSMLSNYSSPGKKRRKDAYAPDGAPGKRPDRATIVYCNRVRELWGDLPLIIGGIEASLRRIAHYDYWSDSVRRSLLIDSRADLLVYGMAEHQLERIAHELANGTPVRDIRDVPGTCWKTHNPDDAEEALTLPPYDAVSADKPSYAKAFRSFYLEQNFARGRRLIQDQGSWFLVHNPPASPLSSEELDRVYALPYARRPHPSYAGRLIPAFTEVQFSVTSHRGCFGECAFCAISTHQGRVIQQRSKGSVVREARILTSEPDFKGYIHDVGGPTANFRTPACPMSETQGACAGKSCLYPEPCPNLNATHADYLSLLRSVRELPGVKKVFVRSGIRYDYILADPGGLRFIEELCRHHISGQLKIAPEHASPRTLRAMRKSSPRATERFVELYRKTNAELGKKQFLVPYFMSAHPGCSLTEALELALFIRDIGLRPEQVQEFTPTPGTLSTCMYHTGQDPLTGEPVYVPRTAEEKALQRALLQYWMPQNQELVRKALRKLEREDLIGESKSCLVPDRNRRHFISKKR